MKRTAARLLSSLALSVLVLALTAACQPSEGGAATANAPVPSDAAAEVALIPLPAKWEPRQGQFILEASTPVRAEGEAAQRVARQFMGFVAATAKMDLKLANGTAGGIHFVLDPAF